jgi:hypothetical protein
MKRGKSIYFAIFFMAIFILSFVSSETCDLGISLLNQDPYPSVPGEQVKLVFQITGLENTECEDVSFELPSKYPITLSSDQKSTYVIKSGTYERDFESFFLAPYKVILSKDALDGESPIEVRYKYAGNTGWILKEFNLSVEDVRAKFQIYVKDYNSLTKDLEFEILNYGKSDIEALTIEVPKQENIKVEGTNTNIVGDLDSNEYTTADFTAIPKDGNILLNLSYSDISGHRRYIEQNVTYDSEYFAGQVEKNNFSFISILIWGVIILSIVYFFYRRHKKKVAFRKKLKN